MSGQPRGRHPSTCMHVHSTQAVLADMQPVASAALAEGLQSSAACMSRHAWVWVQAPTGAPS